MIIDWKQNKLNDALIKLFKVIKPEDVMDVKFSLSPSEIHNDSWIMNITYVVPPDSKYLKMDTTEFRLIKIDWMTNLSIQFMSFLGARIKIEHISLRSSDYQNDEEYLQAEAIKKLSNLLR